MNSEREITSVPTESKWFEVKPLAIDQKLFEKARKDEKQEKTRQLILEAFEEMSKYSEKYARNFQTMMPKKGWKSKTVAQLKEMACDLGDHNADWVELFFEWAQRISNGESWESICNDQDTAKWYRLVVWKNGHARIVGGSVIYCDDVPASDFDDADSYDNDNLHYTVPLVVSYE